MFGKKLKLIPKFDPEKHEFDALPKKKHRVIVELNLENGQRLNRYLYFKRRRFNFDGHTYLLDRKRGYLGRDKNIYYTYFEGVPLPIAHDVLQYEMQNVISLDENGNQIQEQIPKLKGIKYDSLDVDTLVTRGTFDNYVKAHKTIIFYVILILNIVILGINIVNAYGIFR